MVRSSTESTNFEATGWVPADVAVHDQAAVLVIDVVDGELLDQSK